MTIVELQRALRKAGFDPGPLDGLAGPLTRAALRAFQLRAALRPDGIAGPLTEAALRLIGALPRRRRPRAAESAEAPAALPWLAEAHRLLGTREVKGAASNPAILDWAARGGHFYGADEVPWCGLFVAHCLATTLPEEPQPARPLAARNWLSFGAEVAPQLGAVMVFRRGAPKGWQGHVGFLWAEDDEAYHILGGNQSDAVTIARIARDRLLGARWPRQVPAPGLRRVFATAAGPKSLSEA